MKAAILTGMFGFGAMLAVVIGGRMTQDTMAVVLGVAVGVAASVPVSILLVALVRQAQRAPDAEAALEDGPQQPRVIVIQSDQAAPLALTEREH